MKDKIKSKAQATLEAKQKLIGNINIMLDKGFINNEIAHFLGISPNYISVIRRKGLSFSVSLKKLIIFNKNFEKILSKI